MATFTEGDDDLVLAPEDNSSSLDGLAGNDRVVLMPNAFVLANNIETVIGTGTNDIVIQGVGDSVLLDLGGGNDQVYLDSVNGASRQIAIQNVEALFGSDDADNVVVQYDGSAASLTVQGNGGIDSLFINGLSAGTAVTVESAGFESITATGETTIRLSGEIAGTSVFSANGASVQVDLSRAGGNMVNRLDVHGVTDVTGSDARDVVRVSDMQPTTFLDLGAGTDRVEITTPNAQVTVSNVEALLGSKGNDVVILAGQTPSGMSIDLAGGRDTLAIESQQGEFRSVLVSNAETVYGGRGSESVTLRTQAKDFFFDGGDGYDTLALGNANNSLKVFSVEGVTGGSGIDRVSVIGDRGAYLDGGAGGDILSGGDGSDLILGGLGKDIMAGGGGSDTFRFQSVADSDLATRDIITDFQTGVDKLQFLDVHVAGKESVTQFDFLGSVQSYTGKEFQATGHAQAVFLDTTDQLFLDVDGNGSMDMRMTLQGVDGSQLSATDFQWFGGAS